MAGMELLGLILLVSFASTFLFSEWAVARWLASERRDRKEP